MHELQRGRELNWAAKTEACILVVKEGKFYWLGVTGVVVVYILQLGIAAIYLGLKL